MGKLFSKALHSTMKLIKFITILVVALKLCNTAFQDSNFIVNELNNFMDMLKTCPQLEKVTCYYTGSTSDVAKDIASSFMIKNKECGALVSNTNIFNTDLEYQNSNIFVFVESVDQVSTAAANLIENPLFKTSAYTFFIVTTQVTDLTYLTGVLPYILSKNIVNFLLVCVHHSFAAYTYMPFAKKKIFNVTSTKRFCKYYFLDKVINLNRFPLRAAFYEYPPGIFQENGKWTGIDFDNFLLLADMLNATAEVIPCLSANDTVVKLYANEADIFLVKVFHVPYYENVSTSYSYEMGDRVVVVPKPRKIPAYRYLFHIFDYPTWCNLLLAIFTLRVFYFVMSHIYGVNLNYLIMIWSPLVNLGIPGNLIYNTRQKWLLMIWIYSSMVLGVCFQTSLIRSFLQPRHEKSIKTIDDLRDSQMNIYIHPYHAQSPLIPDSFGLKEYFVHMELSDSIQHMKDRNTSGAFIVSRQLAEYYINENKRISGDPVYEIVKEVLIPGSRVYLLQKFSPLVEKINRFLLLIHQHALLRRTRYQAVINVEGNVLQLSHFLSTFYILALGYLTAFMVFLVEKYLTVFA